jgi:hypothetical protein
MVCPDCGASAYRSRSRNFRETFIKRLTPLKPYRCHECGWRGFAAPARISFPRIDGKVVFIWITGMLFAVAIGFFGASALR